MSWHAVDAVDDAVDATRRFLFPFSLVRWTKLGFLVLLMGGGGAASANASVSAVSDAGVISPGETGSVSTGADLGSAGIDPRSVTPGQLVETIDPGVLAVLAVGIVLLVAAFSVVSLSLRLVFYDALRTNEVRIRQPFRSRLRQSLGLFLFTAVLSAGAMAPLALAVLVASAANAPIGVGPIDSVAGSIGSLATGPVIVLGFVGAAFVAIAALALRFTYEFVVPTIVVEETGVLGGWRRFWRTLRTRWTEFVVYLVVHVIVSVGLSVVEGIAAVLAFALVGTVAGLVLLAVAAALGGLGALVGTTAGTAALAVVVIVAVASLIALVLPVRVVTSSYRIAYEVSTLGGIDGDLALLHRDLDPRVSESAESDAVDSPDP
ncbi:hypothetical protein Hrr1229_014120 [Halorubrum sp. CBA1229]|nr:hypothetical protein Hrr1229_014120 [Halorubrum sp. CBA1229]